MIVVDRGVIIDFSFNYLCLFRRVISMVGKNNKHVQLRQEADKQTRFSLKKLTVGVASIAVGATLLLGQPISVNAEEPSTTQADQSLGEYKEVAKKDLVDKKIENEHLNSLIDSAESKEAVDKLVEHYEHPELAEDVEADVKDLKLYKAAKIAKLKAKNFDNATFLKKLEDAETKEGFDTLFTELEAEVDKKESQTETEEAKEIEESAPTQAAESTETEITEESTPADKTTETEVTSETEAEDNYAEAVKELADLNLSDSIKEDFAQKINEAEDNKEAVSQILTEAMALAELNTKKDAALVEIDQTNLHVDDSNELKGRIEVASSAEEVDNVLVEAQKRAEEQANQTQNGEATTEEKPEDAPKPEEKKPETEKKPAPEKKPEAGQKPEAEKKPDKKPEAKKPENKKPEEKKPEAKKPDTNKQPEKGKEAQPQKPEQKPDQQKQPDKSADKAAQDKKEQELKMAAAKEEAKKEINNLANLSDKQKGELLAGIDKADTPAKIGEILDFARKLNQDQAPKQQKKQGERLPDTATGAWALGLIGATAILAGFGIKKFKK
ncbi:YSIRK-type signal peptide-containing protein [Dolosigranulum pigrum]|nr:YSIRK-type signal peptide-containing protein [Dolosigranulum pigrum]